MKRRERRYLKPKMFVCPSCGGDGKETCNNPDHGFIQMHSFHDIGRIGCPCCGNDERHKIYQWKGISRIQNDCEHCGGKGKVNLNVFNHIADELKYDEEPKVYLKKL